MKANKTFSITDARKNIFKITDELQGTGFHYTLTENGRPKVIMMSADEFESWYETMEVMREMPDLWKTIEKVDKDIQSGEYKNYPTFEELLQERGYLISDTNEIQPKARTERKKGVSKNR